jgi:Chaperone for flagella basal body P-ring formation
MEWDNRQQAVQARLRCSSRASCAPFLVRVVLTPSFSDHWRDELSSRSALNSIAMPTTTSISPPPLTTRGKPATLILEDRGMRISVPVVCLEPGVLNQRIRVFDKQSRHVFLAEIVGAGLLRASL